MKKIFLFLDELKDNLSDFIINTLIITLAAVFISIAVYSVGDYLTSMAYYFNPNTGNIVKIVLLSPESVYEDEMFDLDEFEYSFTSTLYTGAFMYDTSISLFTLSGEFFDEGLGLAESVSYDTLADNSEKINVIAVASADMPENSGGRMNNGMPYTVIKKWDNNAAYHLLSGVVAPNNAAIALEDAVDTDGFQLSSRVVVGKINIGFDEFREKYQEVLAEKGWIVIEYNGVETVASEFESSVTLTVLGTVIFLTACIAIIINNYLSYEKRKRAYEILITLGAHRKLFMFSSLMTRAAQLILSLILSCIILPAAGLAFETKIASAGSVLIAFGVVALLLAAGLVRYVFFLKRTHAAY